MRLIHLLWYHGLIIGMVLALYINGQHIRHWVNWCLVKLCFGVVWFLRKTDSLYEPEPDYNPYLSASEPTPKPKHTKPQKPARSPLAGRANLKDLSDADLRAIVEANDQLEVEEKV